ncbi:MAG: sigma-54 dependent transcriptional regulator, partial [Nitrospira sp.]|nr:sigma-54 dependent transcriptional regulator [Nitrospira sp.]
TQWDVVLTDLRMPGMDGLTFLKELKSRRPEIEVILMTAHGSVASAVSAIREGAYDYLTKPFEFDDLAIRLERLAEFKRIQKENQGLRKTLNGVTVLHGLVGSSAAMQQVFTLVDQFAGLSSNVLLQGETGTGKELVARAIHAQSPRSKGPFVPVSCAAIPRELAESELFGHESGAFTGATKQHRGRIEMAEGGTLFLDDIDDMPIDLQAKLLRVIQERKFERVGGEKSLSADVRLITATKVDLEALAKTGKFRDDLMYRINVLTIPLTPLRDRREDIPLLAQYFLSMIALEQGKECKPLTPQCIERLAKHEWPGNVRELRHAMEYAMAVSTNPSIEPKNLPSRIGTLPKPSGRPYELKLDGLQTVDLRALEQAIEKEVISWALEMAAGNQIKAAQMLNIPRSTLQSKMGKC